MFHNNFLCGISDVANNWVTMILGCSRDTESLIILDKNHLKLYLLPVISNNLFLWFFLPWKIYLEALVSIVYDVFFSI